ncbi:exopolysaccharide biosynthesis polyprenyl glycosylphosphotransferase [Bifidobacterium lemurum]|uniref:Exopolysaccharide biosynthesis polyprenyl glycosylphosphotransferase n=1 Tax=Bifidobacterium lemurum TaxID=1603886 RepID=A0A261FQ79_9BIFI|nr:sugar transferase [Bifidobacterium lemurum]OZG61341.1 exopolysaccharide biosynthesis polyprenyl glycosylphosphotransferase [Bifidobacterium lemurum]QOL34728.1 sugar transferase [Bifidobacterium lemurum]
MTQSEYGVGRSAASRRRTGGTINSREPAPATFFDGSYFSVNTKGIPQPNDEGKESRIKGYSVPQWRYVYTATLAVLDAIMPLLASAMMFLLNRETYDYLLHSHNYPISNLMVFLVLTCLSWLASLAAMHCYERHLMGEGYTLYSKIISAGFAYFIILCTAAYLFKLDLPRSLNVFVPILATLFTLVERWCMRMALHRNRKQGEYNYPTILIGSPEGIHTTITRLRKSTGIGYKPIAVCPVALDSVDDGGPTAAQHLVSVPFTPRDEEEARLRVLALNSHLPQTAKQLGASSVLIADVLTRESETMRTLSLAVESMGIELAFTTSVADLGGSLLHLRNDPTMPVLTARLPQYSQTTRIIKRLFDIVLSSFALIISSPIMLWVAFKVKQEDGGPVFYSQQRIGIYGKPFTMYKFRSMRTDADEIKARLAKENGMEDRFIFKLKDDPRVTKIGKFIRKTSLDEFPQFFNVFKGDMSLVGPRPPLPEEVARYGTLYSTRLLVKPGITGPWQVSGRSDLTKEQSEFADVSYIQTWSITGDIALLCKTVMAVLRGTGSY